MLNGKQLLAGLSLFGVAAFWGNDGNGNQPLIRRLAAECIHNVYATAETVTKIPPVPPSQSHELPSYISLCQEWIRHDAYYNETNPHDHYQVVEAENVCADWSAPHHTIMDIHAALIVTNQMDRIKYRHNCDRTRVTDEATLGFDHTTIQQILNTPGIATTKELYSAEEMKQQCRRCLLQHDPSVENARVKAKAVHHCFAWPEDVTRVLDANALPISPNKANGVTPFSTIVGPFRNRMYLSALEWQNVTDKPPTEEAGGLVIWLDPTSTGLDYETITAEIDLAVTSISILAGPTCATAIFPTGQVCHEYGKGLRDHLRTKFPDLSTNGWQGGPGVSFKITASTAAGFSRMVLAKELLCPPRSPSCYTPAVSKILNKQSAMLLEDPAWMKAVDFFTIAGTHGVVMVKVLDAALIPAMYTGGSSRRRHLEDVPEQFSHVNAMVDGEGYPVEIKKIPIATDEAIAQLTDQQILDDIAIALGRFLDNPNVHSSKLEIIPTLEMIQEAISNGVPLDVNDVKDHLYPEGNNGNGERSGTDTYRHGELASDVDSGRIEPSWTVEFWEAAFAQRHDSLLRIQSDWQTSFHGHIQNDRAGDDPSTIYEIPCPLQTADGGTVSYLDGTATTTTPTTIVVATKDGVVIRDPETGETTGTGIENAPDGSSFIVDGGYKIKEPGDTSTNTARRLVLTSEQASKLPFMEELEHVCREYHRRKLARKQVM